MSEYNVPIALVVDKGNSLANLWIEQEEYDSTDGLLSTAGLHNAILDFLDSEQAEDPDCTLNCRTYINVYFSEPNIGYELYAVHGSLGTRIRQNLFYTEKLDFALDNQQDITYPSFGLISVSWVGNKIWNENAEEMSSNPSYTLKQQTLELDQKVYGTALVTYRIVRDRYGISLPEREEAEENKFSSVVYALWSGGPTWLIVKPPPGAEDTGYQCTGGGGILNPIDPPEPGDPPTAPHKDAKVITDYCSREITRNDLDPL